MFLATASGAFDGGNGAGIVPTERLSLLQIIKARFVTIQIRGRNLRLADARRRMGTGKDAYAT